MRAMILAAGRGSRMRELTRYCPKPMLEVGGEPMIVRLIRQLGQAGIHDLIINLCWHGEKISAHLGDGTAFATQIRYSHEAVALETAGGITAALPLLGDEPFLVVNGDVVTDFDFRQVLPWPQRIHHESLLGIGTLVANPAHNAGGDFSHHDGLASNARPHTGTWAGIAVMHPRLLDPVAPGTAVPLAPLLRQAASIRRLGCHWHKGQWSDVGTPERLAALNEQLRHQARSQPDHCHHHARTDP